MMSASRRINDRCLVLQIGNQVSRTEIVEMAEENGQLWWPWICGPVETTSPSICVISYMLGTIQADVCHYICRSVGDIKGSVKK